MTKSLLLIFLVIFQFTVVGCQETLPSSQPTEHNATLSFIKDNGILKVKDGKKSCLLADDAIAYETFVSPDASMIAVETLLMSNLQIIRVYNKDLDGCFLPLKNALSTKLWHNFSEKEGFSIDEVNHPRMRFLKWIDNERAQIELSGEVDSRVIDANVSYDLKQLY